MRALVTLALSLLLCPALAGSEALQINITDIDAPEGRLNIAIAANEAQYNSDEPSTVQLQADPNGAIFSISVDVPPGDYAVRLFLDKNRDGKLNRNFVGIPNEPWAMSGKSGGVGAPSWEEAKFNSAEQSAVSISLK